MTDIASLGLEIRSDGVVVAKDRLRDLTYEASLSERAAGTLKRAWQMSLAALAAGAAAFGVGIAAAVKRMEEMRRMSAQVDQALRNSGNTARTSAREIEAWADSLERRTGRAAEDVMGVAANLASFGFGRSEFFRSLELANDMAAAWGGDLRQNLEGLARALDNPLTGMAMLSKRGIQLTQEQKDMAAAFLDAGDKVAAQGVVFEALEAQVKGVAEAGFGGLTKAWAQASKAWEDAFEDMVKGEGQASDLRDTLSDLASTISSPEFIGAVMGFGNMIIGIINGIAQVAIGAHAAFKDFMAMVNAPGGAFSNFQAKTAPLNERSLAVMQQQLLDKEDALARSLAGNGGSPFGIGAEWDRDRLRNEIAAIKQAIAARSTPSSFDVNGVFSNLGGQTYDNPEDMWKGLAPGTMFGQTPFDPYEGMDFTTDATAKAAEKAAKAYADLTRSAEQFITEQQLEAQTLGMTEEAASRLRHEQDLLNKAANDNIALTPKMRGELADLASQMAAAEEATRRLTEIYEFGKGVFQSFFQDVRGGIEEGKGLWESLGTAAANALDSIAQKALDMAANGIWDMIFGAFTGSSGQSSGLGGIGGFLGSLFGGNRANGGPVEPGRVYRVNENTANSEWFAPSMPGTIIPSLGAANQNQANDNYRRGDVHVHINGSGLSQEQMTAAISDALDYYDRKTLPSRVNELKNNTLVVNG